jgi:LytS/YehU family sensor histidine kinase
MFAWAVWDIVAYATIVAFGTVATLAGRHRESLVAMIGTRSRIANARLASLRLRLQPAVLLRGLDAIGVAMATDPERAEHAIARMGDLLRALLTRVDRDSVSLDTELSALQAFLDVVAPDTTIVAANEVRDVIVPAMLLTALASAMDQLASIDIQSNDGALEVHLHATSGSFDERQLAQIRERVRRRYDDAGTVTVDRLAEGGFDVKLQLPIEQSAVLEDDELILQPAVGVA